MPIKGPTRVAVSWASDTKKGRPDYSPQVAASKLVIDALQTKFYFNLDTTIVADTLHEFEMYTVPVGYSLTFGSIVISCSASILQKLVIHRIFGGVNIWDILDHYIYDARGEVIFGAQNAVEIPAESVVYVKMWNYDEQERRFGLSVQGFLERRE